jgi:hypothetical protein
MSGQNNLRANQIIGQLVALRESLDTVLEDVEQELGKSENGIN